MVKKICTHFCLVRREFTDFYFDRIMINIMALRLLLSGLEYDINVLSILSGEDGLEHALFSTLLLQTSVSSTTLETINQECFADSGDNVTLKCYISNKTLPIIWLKHFNQTISVGDELFIDDPRFLISASNFSILEIQNVSSDDTGYYECRQHETNKSLDFMKNVIQLIVRYPPVILSVEPEEVITTEGNDIQLFCNATGHPLPNVTWRKINRSIPPLDDIVFTGGRLNISNVKKADGGIYSCEAENGFGQRARRDVLVHVEFAPEVISPNNEILQAVNYTAELLCIIEAFPLPAIIWLKDEEEITVNDSHYIINIITSSNRELVTEAHLQLAMVRRADFGNYSCRASNKLGESGVIFSLLESPFPVLPLIKENGTDAETGDSDYYPSSFNVTGFILGMMPPLWISFYIILHLGFRSRYAEERPEEEGGDGLDEIAWEQGLHFTSKF